MHPLTSTAINRCVYPNPITNFVKTSYSPNISSTASISPQSCIIGCVVVDDNVNVAPFASIRGDEGTPIYVGKNSNVQEGVVIHGLKDKYVDHNGYKASVYIGNNVSLAHQSQVHGPSKIGDNVFVGMQSFVFKSVIGNNVVIEPGAKVIGVNVRDNSYIPAGSIIKTQEDADKLPKIDSNYTYKDLNSEVVEVNKELASGYNSQIYSYPQNYYLNKLSN